MATIVIKTIKGRQYRYLQSSYRSDGKVRTHSTYIGPVEGNARKAADEKYREVLRDNAYQYGRSRPGARYASEARAREQYHRDLGFKSADKTEPLTPEERHRQAVSDFWFKVDSNQASNFEKRHREYNVTHTSAAYRAEERFHKVRDEVQKEDARQTAQEASQREQTAQPKSSTVDDEIDARQAQHDEAVDEYNAGTTAAPDSAAPADAPSPDAQGQQGAPDGDAGPGSSDGPQ